MTNVRVSVYVLSVYPFEYNVCVVYVSEVKDASEWRCREKCVELFVLMLI